VPVLPALAQELRTHLQVRLNSENNWTLCWPYGGDAERGAAQDALTKEPTASAKCQAGRLSREFSPRFGKRLGSLISDTGI
jgi:hypothetical protein